MPFFNSGMKYVHAVTVPRVSLSKFVAWYGRNVEVIIRGYWLNSVNDCQKLRLVVFFLCCLVFCLFLMRIYVSSDCLDVKLSTGKPKHPRPPRQFFYEGYSRKNRSPYSCREINKCQITQPRRLKFFFSSFIGSAPQIEQSNVNIINE